MTTARSKRWNGKPESLSTDFLTNVLTQMGTYGDRVQFALSTPGAHPHYQVVNSAEKKIAFDGNHHLLHPQASEFDGANATAWLSIEQIRALQAGEGVAKKSRTSATKRAPRTSTVAAKAADLVDAAKYEYFRTNRQSLPASIGTHSDEISALMRNGLSAQDAFGEVIKRHF